MAAFDMDLPFLPVRSHCLLGQEDRRGGLDIGANEDLVSVTDAAQDPAGMVGGFDDAPFP